jgi:hypothetical protein
MNNLLELSFDACPPLSGGDPTPGGSRLSDPNIHSRSQSVEGLAKAEEWSTLAVERATWTRFSCGDQWFGSKS